MYNKDVDVYWQVRVPTVQCVNACGCSPLLVTQRNAWADTDVSVEWMNRTWKRFVKEATAEERDAGIEARDDDVFCLLCDNLNSQVTMSFKRAAMSSSTYVYNLPPNCTCYVQPVDAGTFP